MALILPVLGENPVPERPTKKGKTANIMTLKTGEKFHTEILTSSERKSVKIMIRVMKAMCCNQETEICSTYKGLMLEVSYTVSEPSSSTCIKKVFRSVTNRADSPAK